jgi:hypothetical protein
MVKLQVQQMKSGHSENKEKCLRCLQAALHFQFSTKVSPQDYSSWRPKIHQHMPMTTKAYIGSVCDSILDHTCSPFLPQENEVFYEQAYHDSTENPCKESNQERMTPHERKEKCISLLEVMSVFRSRNIHHGMECLPIVKALQSTSTSTTYNWFTFLLSLLNKAGDCKIGKNCDMEDKIMAVRKIKEYIDTVLSIMYDILPSAVHSDDVKLELISKLKRARMYGNFIFKLYFERQKMNSQNFRF